MGSWYQITFTHEKPDGFHERLVEYIQLKKNKCTLHDVAEREFLKSTNKKNVSILKTLWWE